MDLIVVALILFFAYRDVIEVDHLRHGPWEIACDTMVTILTRLLNLTGYGNEKDVPLFLALRTKRC
jgi:hypothetical protein